MPAATNVIPIKTKKKWEVLEDLSNSEELLEDLKNIIPNEVFIKTTTLYYIGKYIWIFYPP